MEWQMYRPVATDSYSCGAQSQGRPNVCSYTYGPNSIYFSQTDLTHLAYSQLQSSFAEHLLPDPTAAKAHQLTKTDIGCY